MKDTSALHIDYSLDKNYAEVSELMRKSAELVKSIKPYNGELPTFKKLTTDVLDSVWHLLEMDNGRTTDFSYGGLLMWVDYFNYSYAIINDTLFIKGVVEDDINTPAFALPVGKMTLEESLGVIQAYCKANALPFEFSAIPESSVEELIKFRPKAIEELADWGDYLYDAQQLATLSGKKMGKKRNHVNKFMSLYPDYRLEPLTTDNYKDAEVFMDLFDKEGDSTEMAIIERKLSRKLILDTLNNKHLVGAILYVGSEVAGFTIGDVKNDTLYVHVEKCTRNFDGSYEMINKLFVNYILEKYPNVRYVNREDDSGDEGLRKAKQSYHPLTVIKKYNVIL